MRDLIEFFSWIPLGSLLFIVGLIVLGLYLIYRGRNTTTCQYVLRNGRMCQRKGLRDGYCSFHTSILRGDPQPWL